MTGHIVGIDPMTDRIVVLRKGRDGKAVRQVDVLTTSEAIELRIGIEDAIYGLQRAKKGQRIPDDVPQVEPAPEPEQAAFDLDGL